MERSCLSATLAVSKEILLMKQVQATKGREACKLCHRVREWDLTWVLKSSKKCSLCYSSFARSLKLVTTQTCLLKSESWSRTRIKCARSNAWLPIWRCSLKTHRSWPLKRVQLQLRLKCQLLKTSVVKASSFLQRFWIQIEELQEDLCLTNQLIKSVRTFWHHLTPCRRHNPYNW